MERNVFLRDLVIHAQPSKAEEDYLAFYFGATLRPDVQTLEQGWIKVRA